MNLIKRNAIIMAAGTSSRFVPLSWEIPKGLLEVNGEILIERQIRQLQDAGIFDITIVVGYKAEKFTYLKSKYGVDLVINDDFDKYNNTSSIIRVLDRLHNTYICSSDNYFPENVFLGNPSQSYYSALYANGATDEYCIISDSSNNIINVRVGGYDSWYMIGHVYFSDDFSKAFKQLLISEYKKEEIKHSYWEDVYIQNIGNLPKMAIKKYREHDIEEFDSIDELRLFDKSYVSDTRSTVIKTIANKLQCREENLTRFQKVPNNDGFLCFSFLKGKELYVYSEQNGSIIKQ